MKSKKGDINIFMASAVALFVLLVLFLIFVFSLQPIIVNSKIHQVTRQALLKMETDGGITSDTRQKIINNMDFKGFDQQYLTIEPATDITDSTKAGYGDEIYLEITYTYKYYTLELKGITGVERVQEQKIIKSELRTTSKSAN